MAGFLLAAGASLAYASEDESSPQAPVEETSEEALYQAHIDARVHLFEVASSDVDQSSDEFQAALREAEIDAWEATHAWCEVSDDPLHC